jgi:K+-transporting ATPase ATPase A chain
VSDTLGGLLTITLLVALLAAAYVPYGDYMARVFTSTRHLRVERAVYRLSGVNPDAEQGVRSYATSVIGFSLVSIVVLMAIQLGQAALPMDRDLPGVPFWMSFNTAGLRGGDRR